MNREIEIKKDLIVKAADAKLAQEITVLDLGMEADICQAFIIMTARNINHTRAIADHIEEEAKKAGIALSYREGYRAGTWILMDMDEIIVHIFTQKQREYYDLEGLWQ